jgi:hypothetical protein
MPRSRSDFLRAALWLALAICLVAVPRAEADVLPPATAQGDIGLNGNTVAFLTSFGSISAANTLGAASATAIPSLASTSATSGTNPSQLGAAYAEAYVSYYFEISGPPGNIVPIIISASGSSFAPLWNGGPVNAGWSYVYIATVGGGNLVFGDCSGVCSPGSSPNFSTTVSTTAQANTPINVFLSSRSTSYPNPTPITVGSSVSAPGISIDPSYPNAAQYTVIQSPNNGSSVAANNLGSLCPPELTQGSPANPQMPVFASALGLGALCQSN